MGSVTVSLTATAQQLPSGHDPPPPAPPNLAHRPSALVPTVCLIVEGEVGARIALPSAVQLPSCSHQRSDSSSLVPHLPLVSLLSRHASATLGHDGLLGTLGP